MEAAVEIGTVVETGQSVGDRRFLLLFESSHLDELGILEYRFEIVEVVECREWQPAIAPQLATKVGPVGNDRRPVGLRFVF